MYARPRPDLPPGPLRELKDFLHELYARASPMTLEQISTAIAADDDLDGAPSRDTIHRCFTAPELPPNQHDVVAIAAVLARPARWDPAHTTTRARDLWVTAAMDAPAVLGQTDRAAYLEAVSTCYRVLDLAALTPEAADEMLPMLLRQVFVPQQARADPPPVELPRNLWRRLVESGDLDRDMLPPDLNRELLARARDAHTAQPSRPVLELLGDPTARLVTLLGDPGAGKSSLLRWVAVNLASPDPSPDLAGWAGWLPVLIELRDYVTDTDWRIGQWADANTSGACALFTDTAEAQLAAALDAPDCPSAVLVWHAQVTRPDSYGLSNWLQGDTSTVSADRETATVTGCGPSWVDPLTGFERAAGSVSLGRIQLRRGLGLGLSYEITDYQTC